VLGIEVAEAALRDLENKGVVNVSQNVRAVSKPVHFNLVGAAGNDHE
jgi:hypothetical protein